MLRFYCHFDVFSSLSRIMSMSVSPLLLAAVVELLSIPNILRIRCSGSTGEESVQISISGSRIPLVASLPTQSDHFDEFSSLYSVRVPVASMKSILAVPCDAVSPSMSLLAKLSTTMVSIHLEVNFAAAASRGVEWMELLPKDPTLSQVVAGVTENLFTPTHAVSKDFALNWTGSSITFKRAEHIGKINTGFMKNAKLVTEVNFGMTEDDHDNYGSKSKFERTKTFQNVKSLGSGFMQGASLLRTIDLSGFVNVTTIGSHFLEECKVLDHIDLTPFSNVTTIGNAFLVNCKKLEVVDLTPLAKHLSILGSNCFCGCSSLSEVVVTTRMRLQSVGANFGARSGLVRFSTSWFGSSTTSVGQGFLQSCRQLKSVDVSEGLSSITSIESDFIAYCPSLRNFVTVPGCFSAATSIRDNFLRESALQQFSCVAFPNVIDIGDNFMMDCVDLQDFSASGLSSVQRISHNFVSQCANLTIANFSGLSSLLTVGNLFAANSFRLKALTFTDGPHHPAPWSLVTRVGDNFLRLSGISQFSFFPFTSLSQIGHSCLSQTKVKSVTCEGLISIRRIGGSFMGKCVDLKSINLSGLETLDVVGAEFIEGYSRLKTIDLSPLTGVTRLGPDFLSGCMSLVGVDYGPVSGVLQR